MSHARTLTDERNAAEFDRAVAEITARLSAGADAHPGPNADDCGDPLCHVCVPDPAGDDAYAAEYGEYLSQHTPDMGEADPAADSEFPW
jgi:hypothetical protein